MTFNRSAIEQVANRLAAALDRMIRPFVAQVKPAPVPVRVVRAVNQRRPLR